MGYAPSSEPGREAALQISQCASAHEHVCSLNDFVKPALCLSSLPVTDAETEAHRGKLNCFWLQSRSSPYLMLRVRRAMLGTGAGPLAQEGSGVALAGVGGRGIH